VRLQSSGAERTPAVHAAVKQAYGEWMDIRCLGPLSAFEGERVLPLGGPKQRLVLAHLLVRVNQVVQADRLIDEVWGPAPPEAARSSLQSYLSRLRKTLGPDRIESHGHGYLLRIGPEELDTARMAALAAEGRLRLDDDPVAASRALDAALGLWRGPPFADLAGAPSLQGEIARLEELRLSIVEDRIAAELAQGHAGPLVGELESLTAAHPLRERLWGALMLALYRSERQAEALAAYDRARRLLDDELGIDPSSSLQQLHEQILRHDPALQPATRALRGYHLLEPIGRDDVSTVYRAIQPHVGREVAVKAIHADLANAPEFIRRFDAEAQAVARLEHPHVVPVHDYWREPDGAYLVMRLLRGGTLRDLLDREAPLDPEVATRIGGQIGEALATAHAQGILHRAVEPTKILFDEVGNAYLSGFVIGLEADGRPGPVAPGGRPYRSPERRDGAAATAADDVYSLGVLLGELLCEPTDDLREVVTRATAADPRHRYVDASSLLIDLRATRRPDGAARTGPAPPPAPTAPRNPYKGLRAFTEADAPDFFGREVLTGRLLTRLRQEGPSGRFLAVVGPSGSGKSSVVRAGLVPALLAGALPGSERWFVAQMTPGEDPIHELEAALLRVAVDPPAAFAQQLEEGRAGLTDLAKQVLPDEEGELLLVVDQFEEVFTLVEAGERRDRFLELLVEGVTTPGSRVRVVVTLRADLYDRPLRHRGLAELVRARTEAVVPLTAEELERAVNAPAERVGVGVEPRLLAQVVRDVMGQPGALPLLQYALTELFDRRQGDRLTSVAYAEIGGVAGALARRAEEVFTALPDGGREAARQLFLRLVNLGDGVDATGRRAARTELPSLEADPEAMTQALEAFGQARLLSFDRDPETRGPTVEVAHESLLREWGRLRGWIESARDDVRVQRRLASAAQEWLAAGREPSFLLAGARLEQAGSWRAHSGLATTPDERDFLDSSIAERDRRLTEEEEHRAWEQALELRSYRRLRALVAVLCVAALVASGLTVFGFTQRDRAEQEAARAEREAVVATARALAASAVANLEVDPERSVLLALEAVEQTRALGGPVLPEAEEALHRAVGASRIIMTVPGVGGALSWSSDGSVFVTEGPEDSGVIDIRDATTGASVRSWHGHDVDVNDVEFSPDGAMLATAGDDGAARVWDVRSGEELWAAAGEAEVWQPSWSSDGEVVAATWTAERVVRLLDGATGETIHEIDALPYPFATGFSPDGRQVAVSDFESAVHLYDVDTWGEEAVLDHGFVNAVAWSPDGAWIATGSADATVRIWDARSLETRFTLHGHRDGINGVAWSPDSTRVVTGSADGSAKVWEVDAESAREAISLSALHLRGVIGVAFSPDGERVMAGDTQVTAVQVWDVGPQGDGEWATFPARPVAWNATAFTVDGEQLVASDERVGGATVWDLASGDEQHTLEAHDDTVSAIAVAPRSGLITTAGGTTAVTSDPVSGVPLFTHAEEEEIQDVAWSPDGAQLAVASRDAPIRVLDATGEEVAAFPWGGGRSAHRVQFSPDGRLLGAVRDFAGRFDPKEPQVRIWDWAREEVVRTIDTHAEDLAFDPTGATLATAHPGGDIEVWDMASGERLRTLAGHHGPAVSIAFSPDGSRLVSGGSDATVRVWDPEAGVQMLELDGHEGLVFRVRFSPDGTRIASSDANGVVRVWAFDLDDLIGIAHTKLTRSLTEAECRQYLHLDRCP
jgi:WD40 repeat protein/DNA-binding SARP family transcriptional activator/type II secretory pathway predicted ATPase ExeA